MNKQITIILTIGMLLSMMGLVWAETYYVGDSFEIPTDFEIVNCSATDGTYGTDGLDLNWSGKNILISTSPYSLFKNFSLSVNALIERIIFHFINSFSELLL